MEEFSTGVLISSNIENLGFRWVEVPSPLLLQQPEYQPEGGGEIVVPGFCKALGVAVGAAHIRFLQHRAISFWEQNPSIRYF